MIRRRRVRRMVAKQQKQPEKDTQDGVGPDGKLLPGYRYAKGGKVVRSGK